MRWACRWRHAACADTTYAAYKVQVSRAVRVADMHNIVDTIGVRKSTLREYLAIAVYAPGTSGVTEFPNAAQRYLRGVLGWGQRLKFRFRSGMILVGHRQHRLRLAAAAACPFCPCLDETAAHFALRCPAFGARREQFVDEMAAVLGLALGLAACEQWAALPDDLALRSLLGDSAWGDRAVEVDRSVCDFLADIWAERGRLERSPVVPCTSTAGNGARAHGASALAGA